MNIDYYINPLSDVQTSNIGRGSKIWQFVVILPGASIGQDVNICAHCFIENDVSVGDRVTIKSGVYLWDGLEVGDDVFIGPNVTFTNDKYPRSKKYPMKFLRTRIRNGASLGAGCVILPGIEIGEHSLIAAGSVVTKNVPPNTVVVGSPARIMGDIGKYYSIITK